MTRPAVTKAVIPAAGLGTRFLPATKSVPKELLPLVDKPSIQYVVEEAARVGVRDVVVVTAKGKEAIQDYFTRDPDLEAHLEEKKKTDALNKVRAINDLPNLHYVLQREPLGLGHAVGVAREQVNDQAFAVLLPDDIMIDDAALLRRMIETHEEHGGTVLALLEVARDEIAAYGAATVEPVSQDLVRVRGVVEKPKRGQEPSNLAVIGRYVLPPEIFDAIERTQPGVGGEVQLTDAIALLMEDTPVHGVVFSEGRFDTGTPAGFLRTNLELALRRADLAAEVEAMLSGLRK